MAKWCRFKQGQNPTIPFGKLSSDELKIQITQGDLFSSYSLTDEWISLAEVELVTPCTPSKFIGLWNNFHELAKQQGNEIPTEPLYFIKGSNSYLDPQKSIKIPKTSTGDVGRVLYEGELGIVIGKVTKEVSPDQAKDSIFGFTCVNDVTALEILSKDASFKQWTRSKSYDTFGPFGPVIATDIDYQSLTIKTLLNGRERQSYPAADMIFSPQQIVSFLSYDMTLMPGDVIACGTSVGAMPIKNGQTVEIVIDGIGTLSNGVLAEV